jgi:hypothetical protein
MQKKLQKLPVWLVITIGFAMVGLLGYLDYLTGDYSLLIFYAIPVALVAWCLGRWGAVAISIASGLARLASDYISYHGTAFKYWNSLQDMVFLLMVGLLIAMMKELMIDANKSAD